MSSTSVNSHNGAKAEGAAGGEVLVTRPVVERARGENEFDRIAEVRLKGFSESTEVFIARRRAA